MLAPMLREVLVDADTSISQSESIVTCFIDQVGLNFQILSADKKKSSDNSINFDDLSLAGDEDRELTAAVEGMIGFARNEHLTGFISFNTRLNSLFEGNQVNEASNPLDPQQLVAAFKQSIQPLDLGHTGNLALFRHFNSKILRNLNLVLAGANQVLIENGVIPDLSVGGIARPRSGARKGRIRATEEANQFGLDADTEPGRSRQAPELFSVVQDLLRATP